MVNLTRANSGLVYRRSADECFASVHELSEFCQRGETRRLWTAGISPSSWPHGAEGDSVTISLAAGRGDATSSLLRLRSRRSRRHRVPRYQPPLREPEADLAARRPKDPRPSWATRWLLIEPEPCCSAAD